MAFEIEKGIEIPRIAGRGAHNAKYPWKQMEVGDSFFAPKPVKAMATQAHNFGMRAGRKFACRTVEGGTRVWRVA